MRSWSCDSGEICDWIQLSDSLEASASTAEGFNRKITATAAEHQLLEKEIPLGRLSICHDCPSRALFDQAEEIFLDQF